MEGNAVERQAPSSASERAFKLVMLLGVIGLVLQIMMFAFEKESRTFTTLSDALTVMVSAFYLGLILYMAILRSKRALVEGLLAFVVFVVITGLIGLAGELILGRTL